MNNFTPGDSIQLIASDFDNINVPVTETEQYYDASDCPMTRAVKRLDPNGCTGQSPYVYENGQPIAAIFPFGGPAANVEQCRVDLLAGNSAFIQTVPV